MCEGSRNARVKTAARRWPARAAGVIFCLHAVLLQRGVLEEIKSFKKVERGRVQISSVNRETKYDQPYQKGNVACENIK
jgi:hypothetical protein